MASVSFRGENDGLQIGINYGSISLPPPERAETPPSPLSTVPFPRDPDFISRDTLLAKIHEKASDPGSRIALIGLGGVGKTQLAIEYSYQILSESPATWVFWVHASNEARFEQSFRHIADQIKVPGRQDPKVNIFRIVDTRLRDEKMGKWVCILDNLDDNKLLCLLPAGDKRYSIEEPEYTSKQPLLEYVPRSRNGSIIITSRTREIALKMVDHNHLIEVRPMESSEALELFQKKLEQPREGQESRQLVNALDFIPLVIVQAASYIRNRAPRYSVLQYLRDFQGSDSEAIRLLKKEAGHIYRDWEAKNSVLVTWQMSFDHIRQTKPSAAELLSLMSFFDPQGIPENLLRNQPKGNYISKSEILDDARDGGETSDSDIDPDFEDDLMTLRDYYLISVSENGNFFTMHRLVQLTTRAWIDSRRQIDQWRDKFIDILYEKFPTSEYKNWETCGVLFPHLKIAISQQPKSQESLLKWATLLYKGAHYASNSGNIADAREMASKSRRQRISLLGRADLESLESTALLATAYRAEGRWKEAENLNVQVMETRKIKLGDDHPDTLSSMASLALTYWNQGRWEEAKNQNVQVTETREKELGDGHPDTLLSMSNLAMTYLKQGQWNEAEKLMMTVMKTRKTKLGDHHPQTLSSMNNLATTYMHQGRREEAENLLVQVTEIGKTMFGNDHPNTLSSMANLALTYRDQGRWEEASMLHVRVMEARKTKLGDHHPDTLLSMNDLAITYIGQGHCDDAEKLLVQAIETSNTKLGDSHPDILSMLANLALTYMNQNRWEEAEKLLEQLIRTSKTKLGDDHPDTLSSMNSLALTYSNQGRREEAEKLLMQVTETNKRKLGDDHPNTHSSFANLAFTWKSLGRDRDALDLLRACLVKQERIIGPDHPETLAYKKILLEWVL